MLQEFCADIEMPHAGLIKSILNDKFGRKTIEKVYSLNEEDYYDLKTLLK